VNILLWHVHGSWTTSFVQGKHRYLVPVNAARDEWGRGRPSPNCSQAGTTSFSTSRCSRLYWFCALMNGL
jgi:hypothetical protein